MNKTILFLAIVLISVLLVTTVVMAKNGRGKPAPTECNDEIDNDGDTYTDWRLDPGCINKHDNSELNPNIECDDGIDNDNDTYIDYPDDSECDSPLDDSEASVTTECNDEINNDFDGLIDYPNDPGCTSELDTSELGTVECDDGTDNDNDTYIDYPADADCDSALDNDETSSDNCSDTDGGLVYDVFGLTYGEQGGEPFNYTDTCFNSTWVDEKYCFQNQPNYDLYDCTIGNWTSCSNGVCV
ncbi:MAG: hypothetical protein ACW99A_21365 [Candidatus Kariarchaeaceae archaeon]|jgi:hypothetical protein